MYDRHQLGVGHRLEPGRLVSRIWPDGDPNLVLGAGVQPEGTRDLSGRCDHRGRVALLPGKREGLEKGLNDPAAVDLKTFGISTPCLAAIAALTGLLLVSLCAATFAPDRPYPAATAARVPLESTRYSSTKRCCFAVNETASDFMPNFRTSGLLLPGDQGPSVTPILMRQR